MTKVSSRRSPVQSQQTLRPRSRSRKCCAWPMLSPLSILSPLRNRLRVRAHGACAAAGIEPAASARRVHASEDALFQLPEVSMGLIPGAGGTVSIVGRIGRQRAALMALTGRRVDARTALG